MSTTAPVPPERARPPVAPVPDVPEPSPAARVLRFGEGALATPANAITVARLLLAIPTLVLIEDRGAAWLTVTLWFVLSCTDGVDGWVARRDGTTRSGAFLDPLADKFLCVGGFVALAARNAVGFLPVLLIAGREVAISAYRTAAGRRGISLPARQLGKWKTVVQEVAVGLVILPPARHVEWLHNTAVWIAVAITLLSALDIVLRGTRATPAPGSAPGAAPG
ncbi:MAG TPA: CDP-alcohol phosphatidyltransferase family protein [Acidimicrobiia bacterium]|nr:CDP-alcohol phosphatidyltransferase family protein [Acidimicrobiia bacterium]